MICPPTIIDLGNDTDAGAWLEAIAFSPCLRVLNYEPADQGADRLANRDGRAVVSPFHGSEVGQ